MVPRGFKPWPRRTLPVSETTTRSRRPLPKADALSSRHDSSLARAGPQAASAAAVAARARIRVPLDARGAGGRWVMVVSALVLGWGSDSPQRARRARREGKRGRIE